jgi:hypothetical protein
MGVDPHSSDVTCREKLKNAKRRLDSIPGILPRRDESPDGVGCQVTLGQKKGQATRIVSRCLWDANSDSYASEYYENQTLYCVCQVSTSVRQVEDCYLFARVCPAKFITTISAPVQQDFTASDSTTCS